MIWIIIIVIILVIFSLLFMNCIEKYDGSDLEVNVNEIQTKHQIIVVLRSMLQDLHSLFEMAKITYWIDGGTLLGAIRHQDVIPWDDDADLAVLESDEDKLLSLKSWLNQMGYGLSKFWGGYKVYPLNGVDIKYYNRNWKWNEVNKEIELEETFNYKYPFVDIFLVKKDGDIFHYANRYVQRVWPNYYHTVQDLLPLKKYQFSDFYLIGPNNPTNYLNRSYGSDWEHIGYKSYDHLNQRMVPLIKFKIEPIKNN
jgi:phosphorylcholine metabolism protein LicD